MQRMGRCNPTHNNCVWDNLKGENMSARALMSVLIVVCIFGIFPIFALVDDFIDRHKKPLCLNCRSEKCKVYGRDRFQWYDCDVGITYWYKYYYKCPKCSALISPDYSYRDPIWFEVNSHYIPSSAL